MDKSFKYFANTNKLASVKARNNGKMVQNAVTIGYWHIIAKSRLMEKVVFTLLSMNPLNQILSANSSVE